MGCQFVNSVQSCIILKLDKNFEEYEDTQNVNWRVSNWDQHSNNTLNLLERETKISLSHLLILYKELLSVGPWNAEKHKEYSQKLNYHFQILYGFTLDNLLKCNSIVRSQDVFDNCIELLHQKLSADEFKKYPSQIEVYCSLIKDIKDYDITLNAQKVLTISLLLINDYINTNKIKGLQCCNKILQCLSAKDFQNGNYYEVIYSSLINAANVKDLELTKLTQKCLFDLLRILPKDVQNHKTECLFANILEQLCTESNLYLKATCFQFTKNLIRIHGINSVKRKKIFFSIVCDSLDICDTEDVWKILLWDVLECLEEWFKYCWSVWKLQLDHKLFSKLMKVLYVTKSEKKMHTKTERIILTLVTLCSSPERKQILNSFEKSKVTAAFDGISLF